MVDVPASWEAGRSYNGHKQPLPAISVVLAQYRVRSGCDLVNVGPVLNTLSFASAWTYGLRLGHLLGSTHPHTTTCVVWLFVLLYGMYKLLGRSRR